MQNALSKHVSSVKSVLCNIKIISCVQLIGLSTQSVKHLINMNKYHRKQLNQKPPTFGIQSTKKFTIYACVSVCMYANLIRLHQIFENEILLKCNDKRALNKL